MMRPKPCRHSVAWGASDVEPDVADEDAADEAAGGGYEDDDEEVARPHGAHF